MDEASVIDSKSVASCLWDMAKLYDSIDWRVLAAQAPKHGYPIRILAIGLIVHTGPRILKDRHAVSEPCMPHTGILAGDTQANAFAKCVLYETLERIHNRWPGAGPFSYVDDLAQTTRGYENEVVHALGPAGIELATGLQRAGCVISTKSVIVASSAKLGKRLVHIFARANITMNQEKAPRDLGVANTAGKRRSVGLVRKRIDKACARNFRIQHLVRKNKKASKVYRTGTYPAATYGHQVAGLNMTRVRKLRTLAVQASGYGKPGRCATTIINLCHGHGMIHTTE